jgi:hypothetical protein
MIKDTIAIIKIIKVALKIKKVGNSPLVTKKSILDENVVIMLSRSDLRKKFLLDVHI